MKQKLLAHLEKRNFYPGQIIAKKVITEEEAFEHLDFLKKNYEVSEELKINKPFSIYESSIGIKCVCELHLIDQSIDLMIKLSQDIIRKEHERRMKAAISYEELLTDYKLNHPGSMNDLLVLIEIHHPFNTEKIELKKTPFFASDREETRRVVDSMKQTNIGEITWQNGYLLYCVSEPDKVQETIKRMKDSLSEDITQRSNAQINAIEALDDKTEFIT